jgi:hypothetical protein
MLINGVIVECARNLAVIAGHIDISQSILRVPDINSYAYYDYIEMEAEYRDKFRNRLNQVEIDLHHPEQVPLKFTFSYEDATIHPTCSKVDANGVQKIKLQIVPKNIENVFINEQVTLTIMHYHHLVKGSELVKFIIL